MHISSRITSKTIFTNHLSVPSSQSEGELRRPRKQRQWRSGHNRTFKTGCWGQGSQWKQMEHSTPRDDQRHISRSLRSRRYIALRSSFHATGAVADDGDPERHRHFGHKKRASGTERNKGRACVGDRKCSSDAVHHPELHKRSHRFKTFPPGRPRPAGKTLRLRVTTP